MQKLYSTIYKSVVRAANDLVKEIAATAGNETLEYWTWENRMDEDQMPRVPLMGVNGFSLDENLGMWLIRFGITLSTIDDANLLDEADMIDAIHDAFGEKKKIDLLDPVTGEKTSELVVTAFEVLPMGQTQMRNYRSIGLEAKRTAA
jgi:hypothetical protein